MDPNQNQPQGPVPGQAPVPVPDQSQDWRNKRYRYHITLSSGQEVDTNYFDTYRDLENWIKSGAAGVLTPSGFVEIPILAVKGVQPIEEGQAEGQQPGERDVMAPPAAPPEDKEAAGPFPEDEELGQVQIQGTDAGAAAGSVIQPNAPPQPAQDSEGTLQIPRD